ncbi:MAG: hypothetical protein WCF90_00780 [Methanomicrobiales archaeon]
MHALSLVCPTLDSAVTDVSARLGSSAWHGRSALITELKTHWTQF